MRRLALTSRAATAWLGTFFAGMTAVADAQDRRHAPALGGDVATVRDASPNAFSLPARVLDRKQRRAFAVGNAFFKDNWIIAPASAEGRDGLGPLFNARSCSACHFKDGRGRAPEPHESAVTGFLLRLGVATNGGDGPDAPHAIYGGQLQDRAIEPDLAEAAFSIDHDVVTGRYADGTTYELLRPRYRLTDAAYGELPDDIRIGPRVAPQVIGLGLLEAVTDETLVAMADPDDRDGDGISGRAHRVTRPNGRPAIGRFGWKATQATVEDQSAAAFAGDIGITSPLFPDENVTAAQRERIDVVSGGAPEVDQHKLDRVVFYTQTLAVPAQREPERDDVRRGAEVFAAIGCAACHVPTLTTGDRAAITAYAEVTFHPFTDLLLHDMGDGLADDKRDGQAGPREWRTPPLWGIGLFETVNGHTRYLHDGRARNLAEAVLWHGGEAEQSRSRFVQLDADERAALLAFLGSL